MIKLTVVTSREPLSKRYDIVNETVTKNPHQGGRMSSGWAQVQTLEHINELPSLINSLTTNQALVFGTPKPEYQDRANSNGEFSISTKELAALSKHKIARTNEYFGWNDGPGLLFVDYDVDIENHGKIYTPDEIIEILQNAAPALRDVPIAVSASASSFITSDENIINTYCAPRGWHFFIPLECGTDTKAIGDAIDLRLWNMGYGFIKPSSSNAQNYSNLIDTSVWQPSRLSFDAGADCGLGLTQHRPDVQIRVVR
jgi:hypothetical protein